MWSSCAFSSSQAFLTVCRVVSKLRPPMEMECALGSPSSLSRAGSSNSGGASCTFAGGSCACQRRTQCIQANGLRWLRAPPLPLPPLLCSSFPSSLRTCRCLMTCLASSSQLLSPKMEAYVCVSKKAEPNETGGIAFRLSDPLKGSLSKRLNLSFLSYMIVGSGSRLV